MSAATIRIVDHINIAVFHVFNTEFVAYGMCGEFHSSQMDGDVGCLA